ncbi:MAG: glycine--tRNA ligase [Candidatus Methanomethylicaceae archaeon]
MDKYDKVIDLAKRRGFFSPSCEIYGGVAGFLDFGPMGTLLKRNIEKEWRETFIHRHHGLVYEIETPVVMPSKVFEASGHVDHFTDLIVECLSCHKKFRADHLILDQLGEVQGIEGKSPGELDDIIREKNLRCPDCGGKLGQVTTFNLLFKTNIGPYAENVAYMRPEAAQGMFVNFKNIYNTMRERLPIGLAQIGKVLRNEISPRQGPIRLREFTIMEIEFFFDPASPECGLLSEVGNKKVRLLTESMVSAGKTEPIEVTIEEAVKDKLILCEWQAYFMALSTDFISDLGVPKENQMFIAKLENERAHYSAQTFDQLVKLERWGWIEVSGHAYRTDYDLSRHQSFSGQDLTVFKRFDTPQKTTVLVVRPKTDLITNVCGKEAGKVISVIKSADPESLRKTLGEGATSINGIEVRSEFVEFAEEERMISGRRFVPHVAEPSFGADRLVYVAMEYAYNERNGRVILALPSTIAPIQVAVFPLVNKDGLREKALEIYKMIRAEGYLADFDDTGSIGRRYARSDEIGTPLAVTIDHETIEDGTVTVRDRDTWSQVRVPINGLLKYIEDYFSKNAKHHKHGF